MPFEFETTLHRFLTLIGDLSLARFEVEMEVLRDGILPSWLGSTLRGAFGQAFKQTVCMVQHRVCGRCLLQTRCPYMYVFETIKPQKAVWMRKYDRVPHPFILHVPLQTPRTHLLGERFRFQFTLFGAALEFLPYLILSWQEMGLRGLGRERLPLRLLAVRCVNLPQGFVKDIFYPGGSLQGEPETWDIRLHQLIESRPLVQESSLIINWLTPVRLSASSGPVLQEIPFSLLISGLVRRLSLLAYFHAGIQAEIDFKTLTAGAAGIGIVHADLHWQNLLRYSNRQKRTMNFGGLIGTVAYESTAQAYFLLLQLGQWIHVGKNTSFGLGQFYVSNPVVNTVPNESTGSIHSA